VTVLVTTERTLTGLLQALAGVSQNLREVLSRLQSAGENGEKMALPWGRLLTPVRGEGPHVLGEYAGDCGILSLLRPDDDLRNGVGGREPALRGGFLSSAATGSAIVVAGIEVMLHRLDVDSSDTDRDNALGGGLASTGVSALRKSVYAAGGVIGVCKLCSCLTSAEIHAETGVSTISDGKEAVFGVCSGGRTGFVLTAAGMMSTTNE
jgi:hypothetical protein